MGEPTAIGRAGGEQLSAILSGLADVTAETADDALALTQLSFSFQGVVALAMADDDPALNLMAVSMHRLRDCLSQIAGRASEDFEVSMLPERPALHRGGHQHSCAVLLR